MEVLGRYQSAGPQNRPPYSHVVEGRDRQTRCRAPEGIPVRAILVDLAVAGEGVQDGSGYGLIDGELRLLHAHRAKNVFVIEFAHGFARGALDDLSEDNVVSVRILLT